MGHGQRGAFNSDASWSAYGESNAPLIVEQTCILCTTLDTLLLT